MGDVPIAYIEGVGGVRVGEDEIVTVGKHDVSNTCPFFEGEGADFYWGGRYCHLRQGEYREFVKYQVFCDGWEWGGVYLSI